MTGSPLEQMVFEALQTCPAVWKREFPNDLVPLDSWHTYTRCIAFMLGGVYPDSTWDRPEMAAWSALLETVRERLATAAELHDFYVGRATVATAIEWLGELRPAGEQAA